MEKYRDQGILHPLVNVTKHYCECKQIKLPFRVGTQVVNNNGTSPVG